MPYWLAALPNLAAESIFIALHLANLSYTDYIRHNLSSGYGSPTKPLSHHSLS
ncbi:MAG: hypothetical protein KME07_21540 [Pegethrix bostrychoides GSE-TBD4-15B]|uniref:Uncharacterized protein n=1 Tax=Pegethrix bostrychoides GSE-TBD4-15B TaxID=2839662 RepID=A0A951U810_9CYAN|nr:hypothetical protein [Pegethrix bostrychoides GSE-TBD4-15B]